MQLRLVGSSLAQVARDLQVAATTVTSVSQGYRRSRRIETAIATKLGVGPEELWPERYPANRGDQVSVVTPFAETGVCRPTPTAC